VYIWRRKQNHLISTDFAFVCVLYVTRYGKVREYFDLEASPNCPMNSHSWREKSQNYKKVMKR